MFVNAEHPLQGPRWQSTSRDTREAAVELKTLQDRQRIHAETVETSPKFFRIPILNNFDADNEPRRTSENDVSERNERNTYASARNFARNYIVRVQPCNETQRDKYLRTRG